MYPYRYNTPTPTKPQMRRLVHHRAAAQAMPLSASAPKKVKLVKYVVKYVVN